eukprot:11059842-Prorocentrum_lima.AAC.1
MAARQGLPHRARVGSCGTRCSAQSGGRCSLIDPGSSSTSRERMSCWQVGMPGLYHGGQAVSMA